MQITMTQKIYRYICFICRGFMDTEKPGNLVAARLAATVLCTWNPLQTKICTVNITWIKFHICFINNVHPVTTVNKNTLITCISLLCCLCWLTNKSSIKLTMTVGVVCCYSSIHFSIFLFDPFFCYNLHIKIWFFFNLRLLSYAQWMTNKLLFRFCPLISGKKNNTLDLE